MSKLRSICGVGLVWGVSLVSLACEQIDITALFNSPDLSGNLAMGDTLLESTQPSSGDTENNLKVSPDGSSVFPITIIDSRGREVIFEVPPERIVAYSSAAVEILFAIGEGHRIVGTHDFVDYPPEANDIARVGSAFDINLEAIVTIEPDLVFLFSENHISDLERTGLRVLYLDSRIDDIQELFERIRLWGQIVGNIENAEAVATKLEARVERLREKLVEVESGPRIFQDEGGLWTPGPDTLVGNVFVFLKLQNIAAEVSGYVQMSPEQIVNMDPEIIIASYGDSISKNPVFHDLSAVRNKRVFVPTSNTLSVAGPRFIDGIEEIANLVYPELFTLEVSGQ